MQSTYTAPTTEKDVKETLKYFNLRPNKDIGQHFLLDATVTDAMVEASGITAESTVLEVGPGLGILTQQLVNTAGSVFAVELDRRLEPILQVLEQQHDNVSVVRDDALKVDRSALGLTSGGYSVVANLPYQITSQFFRMMLTQEPLPRSMTVLIQKEVADRIVAEAGSMSVLALSIQLFGTPTVIMDVPRESFMPPPAVESSVLHISNIHRPDWLNSDREKLFFALVKAGFAQKRKKLINNLGNAIYLGKKIEKNDLEKIFAELKLDQNARAQELSLESWRNMLDKIEYFVI